MVSAIVSQPGEARVSGVTIHPTAIVHPSAEIGRGVAVGPFCVVGADVVLADEVRLISHVVIDGRTCLGPGTVVFPFASLGQPPQDLKYRGEPSRLEIGARNRIREYVTMNPGTEGGGMVTRIGDDGLFMASAHVGHDCILGNEVILANNALLGGHVHLGNFAFVGGNSAVHQFCRVGDYAWIGGMTGVERDVIPFGMATGDRARLTGLNLVGLERRGFPRDDIQALRSAYRVLFGPDGTFAERLDEVERVFGANLRVGEIVEFVRVKSSRGLCQPAAPNGH
jgi:UDP-N-acetylglucosamine acyltransferase